MYNILLSGPNLSKDKVLKRALQKFANISDNPIQQHILLMLKEQQYHLILFQVSKSDPKSVEVLRTIKKKYPGTVVILVVNNDDLNVIARGLDYGAKDVFKKPYQYELIAERVDALLRQTF